MPVLSSRRPTRLKLRHALRSEGFTLIELLVVVSIISLLVAILLPVLSRTRESAQSIQCASNLRQIAVASLYYAGDYRDHLPTNIDEGLTQQWWWQRLHTGDYLSGGPITGTYSFAWGFNTNNTAYHCPISQGTVGSGADMIYEQTYGMNSYLGLREIWAGHSTRMAGVIDRIKNPTGVSLYADMQTSQHHYAVPEPNVGWYNLRYVHLEGCNASFVDGHAATGRDMAAMEASLIPEL